jgi:hypothetical protein
MQWQVEHQPAACLQWQSGQRSLNCSSTAPWRLSTGRLAFSDIVHHLWCAPCTHARAYSMHAHTCTHSKLTHNLHTTPWRLSTGGLAFSDLVYLLWYVPCTHARAYSMHAHTRTHTHTRNSLRTLSSTTRQVMNNLVCY